MITSELTTYSERRKIREELERLNAEGESVDPAIKCRCPICNQLHYKPKKKQVESDQESVR